MRRAVALLICLACPVSAAAAQEGAGGLAGARASRSTQPAEPAEPVDGASRERTGREAREATPADHRDRPVGSGRVGRAIGWVMLTAGATLAVAGPLAARRSARDLADDPGFEEYRSLVAPGVGECTAARAGETFGASPDLVADAVRRCDRIAELRRIRWLLVGLGAVTGVFGLTLVVRQPRSRRVVLRLDPSVGRAGASLLLVGRF